MTNKGRRKRQQRRLEKERAMNNRPTEEAVKEKVEPIDEEYSQQIVTKTIRSPKTGPKSIGVTLSPAFQRRLLTYCVDTERTQAAAARYLMAQALTREGY
jgi:hypothetical protein